MPAHLLSVPASSKNQFVWLSSFPHRQVFRVTYSLVPNIIAMASALTNKMKMEFHYGDLSDISIVGGVLLLRLPC